MTQTPEHLAAGLDAEIARAWPERWRKANETRPGASKRRNNLRKAYHAHLAYGDFVSANPEARCGNCQHMKQAHYRDKPHCELDSDFYGDQLTSPENVCTRHDADAILEKNNG